MSGRTVPSATRASAVVPSGAVADSWPSSLEKYSRSSRSSGSSSTTRILPTDGYLQPVSVSVPGGWCTTLRFCRIGWEHDLDGEDRALAWLRADANPMARAASPGAAQWKVQAPGRGSVRARRCRVDDIPRRSPEGPCRVCRCRCPRPRCSACPYGGGSPAAPCRAWYISMRWTPGSGSSAPADADRCEPKGRIRTTRKPSPLAWA